MTLSDVASHPPLHYLDACPRISGPSVRRFTSRILHGLPWVPTQNLRTSPLHHWPAPFMFHWKPAFDVECELNMLFGKNLALCRRGQFVFLLHCDVRGFLRIVSLLSRPTSLTQVFRARF